MKYPPIISVVMPVHNYGHFIKESIDSILSQTMPDFELIIVNDGSSDNSGEIAHSYTDKRIKVIDFQKNRGCYPARNAGMRIAKGKYICVMDADDVCLCDRLEKQYKFMEENTEIGMIGSAFKVLNSLRTVYRESNYETIKLMMLRFCYLHHPTCMVCTSLVEKYFLYYDESYVYASDYDWQVKASSLFPVQIINDPLLHGRIHDQQISSSKKVEQGNFADKVRINQLSFFGINPNEAEKELHLNFIKGINNDLIDDQWINQWINRLLENNRRYGYYSQEKLQDFLQIHRYQYNYHNNRV